MWRKSCMFYFEKSFEVTVTSSGIATHPQVPELHVYAAKGDSGRVKLTYKDPNCAGKV
ncbi:hypothetical protein [Paraclostridium dentum]|uniref:hypothetical protein n=1 Tax=Paraclostridium dentum TaxID=2662455 RepID=UPI003F675BE7